MNKYKTVYITYGWDEEHRYLDPRFRLKINVKHNTIRAAIKKIYKQHDLLRHIYAIFNISDFWTIEHLLNILETIDPLLYQIAWDISDEIINQNDFYRFQISLQRIIYTKYNENVVIKHMVRIIYYFIKINSFIYYFFLT